MNIQGLIIFAGNTLNLVIPVLIALTLVAFFWGLFLYVAKKDVASGRSVMIAGITALFIMVSVWGIIKVVQNTLLPGVNSGSIPAPCVAQYGDSNCNH